MKIEGKNAVTEALKSQSLTVEKLIVQKGNKDFFINRIVDLAKSKNVAVQFLDEKAFLLSAGENSRGVVAFTTDFKYSEVEDILASAKEKGKPHFILILDGIEDPHNLGSIIRVAECSGVDGIIIPKRRSASVNETVLKISSGAAAHMSIARVENINNTIRDLKDSFINIYALETGGKPVYGFDLKNDLALVVGGEGGGVHKLTKELCDGIITLPMFGSVNSLNASVACGVAVYEVVRQRNLSVT